MGKEKLIQEGVCKYAHKKGVRTIRMYFGPGMQTGWPDVLFLLPGGKPLFIEFKTTGKTPTPKQVVKIEILEELGYEVRTCDDLEEGKKLIDECMEYILMGIF